MLKYTGPVYLRVGRPEVPRVYAGNTAPFEIGKANVLRDGPDLTIIANGLLVAPALDAARKPWLVKKQSSARGARHAHRQADRSRARRGRGPRDGGSGRCREHLAHGGLGSVVAMTVAESQPVPIRFVNLGDQFGESGAPDALLEKYGLTAGKVALAAHGRCRGQKEVVQW